MRGTLEVAQQEVQNAVKYYAKKWPWAKAHLADITQEGILAVLKREQTDPWDNTKGTWATYCYWAAVAGIHSYLLRNRTQASATRPTKRLRHTTCVDAETVHLTAPGCTPEQAAADKQLASLVRQAIASLDYTPNKAAYKVMVDGEAPKDASERYGVPLKRLYPAREHLGRRAKRSPTLKALYEEIR